MEEGNITKSNQNVSPGRKVLGDINHLARYEDIGNPISPTANLKLLTKVASNFEKEGTISASFKKEDVPKKKELKLYYIQQQSDENFKSRKDKSLGSLCSKFLQLFPLNLSPGEHMIISLDQTVSNLGTERRRMYDIINVLESLQMATKVAKNRYMWYGCQYLHITLALLKGLAVRLRLQEQIQFLRLQHKSSQVHVVADNCNGKMMHNLQPSTELHIKGPSKGSVQTNNILDPSQCTPSQPTHLSGAAAANLDLTAVGENSQSDATSLLDNCSERSLGVMCQKFIMLFLISSKSELVHLDLAASVLLTENVAEKTAVDEDDILPCCNKTNRDQASDSSGGKAGRFKTTVRRLYDIANVLTSLGLICKVQNSDSGRKPAFKYIGPPVEATLFTDQDIRLLQATRHSILGSTPCLRLRKSSSSCEASSVHHERKQHDAGTCKMFTHSKSENWSEPRKQKAHHCAENSGSLSDIFHVAEMELKRLENQEATSPKISARRKLFPRHHSETCLVPMSHHARAESFTGHADVHSGVKEGGLDNHMNTAFTEVKGENTIVGMKGSSSLERPLKIQKTGLLHKSNNFNFPVSGKKVKVIRKLVKVESLLSKKENHILPMGEMNCSVIDNSSRASNAVSQFQSPLIINQTNFSALNDSTTPERPHFNISAQPVQSSHVEEPDGLHETSSTDVGSSVPKVLCIGKGVTVIEMKLPGLTQCHTVPSDNSVNVMVSGVDNSIWVPSQLVLPKQVCPPVGYVYQIGTGGNTSGSVPDGNIYQAVQVGSVVQLVPLCNNSVSLTK